ncbi:MAG: hypothetical protein L0338_17765 [Acidobacteria bacterium]|nr:hypothetical protein [Acidobacteriota bacterium]
MTTSSAFLEQRGLLSRGFVEDGGLKQTPQSSDDKDKKYDIWRCVFLDHVDIHFRAGRKKGPNQYGPVLFILDLDILLALPAGSDVLVTRSNPIHWYDDQPDGERWFQSADELGKNIRFGNFDKMLVIRSPSGMLDFPNRRARIMLDNPQRQFSSGQDVYTQAEERLRAAALTGKIQVGIQQHQCRSDCICIDKYAKYTHEQLEFWFT